jgi:hypothetical protein
MRWMDEKRLMERSVLGEKSTKRDAWMDRG